LYSHGSFFSAGSYIIRESRCNYTVEFKVKQGPEARGAPTFCEPSLKQWEYSGELVRLEPGPCVKGVLFFSSLRSCIVPWINMNLHRLSLNQKRCRSHPQLIAWNWERARSNRAWTIIVDRAVLFIFPVCSFFTVFDQGELVRTQGPKAHGVPHIPSMVTWT
jgi:hypothetical protein